MYLSICNEILGLKPEEILDSDFVMLNSILKERNYTLNERNKIINGDIEDSGDKEYKEIIDFNTGDIRKIEKVKSI